jgi:hypothetical protein
MSRADELNNKAQRAILALRKPDASLSRVPNTVRQSIADVIEGLVQELDHYRTAMDMISLDGKE